MQVLSVEAGGHRRPHALSLEGQGDGQVTFVHFSKGSEHMLHITVQQAGSCSDSMHSTVGTRASAASLSQQVEAQERGRLGGGSASQVHIAGEGALVQGAACQAQGEGFVGDESAAQSQAAGEGVFVQGPVVQGSSATWSACTTLLAGHHGREVHATLLLLPPQAAVSHAVHAAHHAAQTTAACAPSPSFCVLTAGEDGSVRRLVQGQGAGQGGDWQGGAWRGAEGQGGGRQWAGKGALQGAGWHPDAHVFADSQVCTEFFLSTYLSTARCSSIHVAVCRTVYLSV